MPSTPPTGTAHRRKFSPQGGPKLGTRRACANAELEGLEDMIVDRFQWKYAPRAFQMEAIKAQLKLHDVLVHAGTGLGKTAIAAGPHAHPSAKGKVTLMVSPLMALHNEMVGTFQEEFKLEATAVNSSNGGCLPEKLQKIVEGSWQIVLISPELLLSRRFIKDVLKNNNLQNRIMSVVVDEAHVISHWGHGFRKKYGELGIVRSFLPKATPIVAVSATLSGHVRRDVLRVLRFDHQNFVDIDVGNDRSNVSIVVRGIQHPLNSYADLDFIIKEHITDPSEIPKTFIYCDNIAMGTEIITYLMKRLPDEMRYLGFIRPYNACFSKEYRTVVMDKFRTGTLRILVCTDAAGMGCNIPDIDLVVQWKLPSSISSWVQRAGRAARAAGHVGLAILLAEPSAYTTILDEHGRRIVSKNKGKEAKKPNSPDQGTSKGKRGYGIVHGSRRGSVTGKHDAVLLRDCPAIDQEAADEGLLSFVQSGTCRRQVLKKIYNNPDTVPTVPCCDICDPSLLDKTRPGNFEKAGRRKAVKLGKPNVKTMDELDSWRRGVKARDFPYPVITAEAILSEQLIRTIASAGPVQSKSKLSELLAGQWGWEDTYCDELLDKLNALDIPALVPLPTRPRRTTQKRPGAERNEDNVRDESTNTAGLWFISDFLDWWFCSGIH
ncbi:P-loop containing nucleoside triphosphate hydrolase protein [Crassisporium funariophilum]|nr:P-loop containing nucleoside triphosphate hydrolase protein [Crassisporium funariophilum]